MCIYTESADRRQINIVGLLDENLFELKFECRKSFYTYWRVQEYNLFSSGTAGLVSAVGNMQM